MKKAQQELTMEELMKQMQESKAKMQNEFIDKIHDMVEHLSEKANKKDYNSTNHEREVFNKIKTIINNMANWF